LESKVALRVGLEFPRGITLADPEDLRCKGNPYDSEYYGEDGVRAAGCSIMKADDCKHDGDPRRPDDGVEQRCRAESALSLLFSSPGDVYRVPVIEGNRNLLGPRDCKVRKC